MWDARDCIPSSKLRRKIAAVGTSRESPSGRIGGDQSVKQASTEGWYPSSIRAVTGPGTKQSDESWHGKSFYLKVAVNQNLRVIRVFFGTL